MRSLLLSGVRPVYSMPDEGEPMGVVQLDEQLSDIEKPPELHPGLYESEIQDVVEATSGKGNTYYQIRWVIPPDKLPVDLQEDYPDGAVFFWNRVMKPNGRDRRRLYALRKFIETIGLSSATTTVDPNEWMGRQGRLQIVAGSWQGEPRAEIRSILPIEAPVATTRGKPATARASNRGGRK